MARYIDADDAIEAMYEQFCYAYCDNCDHEMYSDVCEDCHRKYQMWAASKNVIEHTIDKLPTADVVERRSGHWMWDALGIHCSSCMYKLQTTGLPSYCPNCGAEMSMSMRGDKDE